MYCSGFAYDSRNKIESGRGITDSAGWQNVEKQMWLNDSRDSNQIGESGLQFEKLDDSRIETWKKIRFRMWIDSCFQCENESNFIHLNEHSEQQNLTKTTKSQKKRIEITDV
jgi:hypothetical protein